MMIPIHKKQKLIKKMIVAWSGGVTLNLAVSQNQGSN